VSDKQKRERGRAAVVAVVATAAIASFAVLGGTGLAGGGKHKGATGLSQYGMGQYQYGMGQYQYGMGQYQYGHHGRRVAICHKGRTITVAGVAAWKGHRWHGDRLGTCVAGSGKWKHKHHKGKSEHAKHGESDDHGQSQKGSKSESRGQRGSSGHDRDGEDKGDR
jgi:hypothetical protein